MLSVLRSLSVGWKVQMLAVVGGEVVGFPLGYRVTLREL